MFSTDSPAGPLIASINLCSDQYLLALADPAQIASVTVLAADRQRSAEAALAMGLPVNHGTAEEILAQAPSLVLADGFSNPGTVAMIRRFGIQVLVLPYAVSFDGIVANIHLVAKAIGAPERGDALAARIAAESGGPILPARTIPIVASIEAGGYTQGAGTLLDEAIMRAGGIGLARLWGLNAYSSLSLERLVSAPVALLIEPYERNRAPSLGFALLDHPALQARFSQTHRLALPENLTDCAGPASAEIVPILRAALRSLSLERP